VVARSRSCVLRFGPHPCSGQPVHSLRLKPPSDSGLNRSAVPNQTSNIRSVTPRLRSGATPGPQD